MEDKIQESYNRTVKLVGKKRADEVMELTRTIDAKRQYLIDTFGFEKFKAAVNIIFNNDTDILSMKWVNMVEKHLKMK